MNIDKFQCLYIALQEHFNRLHDLLEEANLVYIEHKIQGDNLIKLRNSIDNCFTSMVELNSLIVELDVKERLNEHKEG